MLLLAALATAEALAVLIVAAVALQQQLPHRPPHPCPLLQLPCLPMPP